jgi:hypothetical protein
MQMTMQQSNKSASSTNTESPSVRFAQPEFGFESDPSAGVWSALDPWKWLATTADRDIDLLDAALLVCMDEYPSLDVAQFKRRLARHRRRMLASADLSAPVFDRLRTLNHYFFGELNFSGNFLDYYDPRNSLLCDVWNRRLGIPLSLAVLYQEFAKSLDMQLEGVLFPGHFLVRLDLPEGLLVLDPFHRGKSLSAEELQLRARAALGNEDLDDVELQEVIAPASRKACCTISKRSMPRNVITCGPCALPIVWCACLVLPARFAIVDCCIKIWVRLRPPQTILSCICVPSRKPWMRRRFEVC